MTEHWRPHREPWYQKPRPWTCSRCGEQFDMPEWHKVFRQWMDVALDQLEPYAPPVCPHCFAVRRLQGLLLEHPDDFPIVQPCEPGQEPDDDE